MLKHFKNDQQSHEHAKGLDEHLSIDYGKRVTRPCLCTNKPYIPAAHSSERIYLFRKDGSPRAIDNAHRGFFLTYIFFFAKNAEFSRSKRPKFFFF